MQNIFNIAKNNYYEACTNSNVIDFWTVYFCRPIASVFIAIIQKYTISPNQITYLSLIVHLVGLYNLYLSNFIIASILIMCAQILDCSDGQLAIIKNMKTIYGAYLDLIFDALKDLASYFILVWLFIGSEFEIIGIFSFFIVSFSLVLDWVNRHIKNHIKPKSKFNQTYREKLGIQFWTGPIRNFLMVISFLATNPQWVLIYTSTIGCYLTIKRLYSIMNKIQE